MLLQTPIHLTHYLQKIKAYLKPLLYSAFNREIHCIAARVIRLYCFSIFDQISSVKYIWIIYSWSFAVFRLRISPDAVPTIPLAEPSNDEPTVDILVGNTHQPSSADSFQPSTNWLDNMFDDGSNHSNDSSRVKTEPLLNNALRWEFFTDTNPSSSSKQ